MQQKLRAAGTPVAAASLSYWQTGRSLPRRASSLRAVDELERLLNLPAGHLSQLLPQRAEDNKRPWDVISKRDLLHDCLERLDLSVARWRGVVNHDHVIIGPQRNEVSITSTQLVHSKIDGMRAFPAIYFQDSLDPVSPSIVAVTNCVVVEQIQVPEEHLVVARLELPRALERGEPSLHAYRIECAPSTVPSHRWERSLAAKHDHLVNTVEFLGDPPTQATGYYKGKAEIAGLPNPEDHRNLESEPLKVSGGIIQQIAPQALSGVHGVSWQW
ncbi:hypothetical protein ACTQ49_12900 [Luteococcus sp. Sow4_B9]|uniref:hypothetical protein n=1 Tax=Luteococcus sp. Sow4_B9 TaxID=3438792 RepID=UPI003F9DA5F9